MTPTALIIEDEALIALELEEILESLGFSVVATAATENDAVEAALELRPQLLLVDIRLAQGDGISAIERITKGMAVRAVYVTANRDELRRRSAGAICVNKPFTHAMIERAIRTAYACPPGGSGSNGGPAARHPGMEPGSWEGGPDGDASAGRNLARGRPAICRSFGRDGQLGSRSDN